MAEQTDRVEVDSQKMPKISVIVPVYNGQDKLRRALDSVLRQQYTNLEIIVVDDCSTDDTALICRQYADKDKRIIFIQQEKNGGAAAARNRALEVMTGTFVAFLDADDMMEPDMLVRMLMIWVRQQCDMVLCNFDRISEEKQVADREPDTNVEVLSAETLLQEMLLDKRQGYLWNKLLKADIIKEHLLVFDEKLAILEDFKFLMEYLLYTKKICYLGRILYHYNIEQNSLSRRSMNSRKMSLHTGSEDIYGMVKKNWGQLGKEGCSFYMNTHMGMLYDCYQDMEQNKEYIQTIQDGMKQQYSAEQMSKKLKIKYMLSIHFPKLYCMCKR